MPILFQYRSGNEADITTVSQATGEILVNTTNDTVLVNGRTVVSEATLAAVSGSTVSYNEYDTVVNMKNDSASIGELLRTSGYHIAGDGGHGEYVVMSSAEYGKTPDGYADHVLANGNIAVLMYNGRANVKQFGAISGGITDSREYIAAAADAGIPLVFPNAERFNVKYSYQGEITFTNSVDFNGSTIVFTGAREHDYTNTAFIQLNSPANNQWTTHGSTSALVTAIKNSGTVTGKYWSGLEGMSEFANHYMIITTNQPFWYYRDGNSYSNPYTRPDMLIHIRDGQMTTSQKYPFDTSTITSIRTLPIDDEYTVYENLKVDLTEIDWESMQYDKNGNPVTPTTPEVDTRDLSRFITSIGSTKVKFKNISFDMDPEPRWKQWHGPALLQIFECCLLEIDGMYSPWPGQVEVVNDAGRLGQSNYTYVLNYGWVNDLKIKNLVAQGDGYGAIGGFWAREVEYQYCDTNRIDAHEPVMGLKVDNCTIGAHGLKLCSIGDVHVTNTTFNGGGGGWVGGVRFISNRPDHRGWCDGHLYVENCTFNNRGDRTFTNSTKVYIQEPDIVYGYSTTGVPAGSPIKTYNWETQTYKNCKVGQGHVVMGNWSNADVDLIESESITIEGFRCAEGAKLTIESNDEQDVINNNRTSYWQHQDSFPEGYFFGRQKNFKDSIAQGARFYNAKPNKTFSIKNSDIDYVAFLNEGEDGGMLMVTIDGCRSNDPDNPMVIKPQYQGIYNITNNVIDSIQFDETSTLPVRAVIKNNTIYNTKLRGMAVQNIQNEYWNGRGDEVFIENNNIILKEVSGGMVADWHVREIVKGVCTNNTVLMEVKIAGNASYSTPIDAVRLTGDGISQTSWNNVNVIFDGYNFKNKMLVYLTAANGDETPYDRADLRVVEMHVPQVTGQITHAKFDTSDYVSIERTNTNEITATTTHSTGVEIIGGIRYKL